HKDDQVLDLASEKYSVYHSAILLASVALTAFAGAAAAEVSLTWGGTATVGMAREGDVDVAAGKRSASSTAAGLAAIADLGDDAGAAGVASVDAIKTDAQYIADVLAQVKADSGVSTSIDTSDAAAIVATVAELRKDIAAKRADQVLALSGAVSTTAAKDATTAIAKIDSSLAILNHTFGGVASTASVGDFDSYSEVNLTATATVTTDYGITVTGAVSVDAGTGYDFADDDGFDAAKTNGVELDYITIDGGSFGALTFDKNDIEHLVDDDDDETADLKYTNDFGVASFAFVMDIAKDTDVAARRETVSWVDGVASTSSVAGTDGYTQLNEAVAADVAWSAMISAPIADMGTVYAAFDEEGGNAFGGSFMVANVTIGLDSKLEALEEELGEDRSNTISVAYSVDGLSLGAEWNS
ncbi:hypothetical protein MWN63_15745, partial [Paradonghicola geojensis]|nr:hypothetical protein [Marivivens geojensis]